MFLEAWYIGHTRAVLESERERHLIDPKVPGSYSKPESIAKYIAEAIEARKSTLASIPYIGSIDSMVVLDANGTVIFEKESTLTGRVAMDFLSFLSAKNPAEFELREWLKDEDRKPSQLAFVGFDIDVAMRLLCLDILSLSLVPGGFRVPIRLWYNPINCYDPAKILLPTAEEQRNFDLVSIIDILNIDEDIATAQTNPLVQARLAMKMAEKVRMFA